MCQVVRDNKFAPDHILSVENTVTKSDVKAAASRKTLTQERQERHGSK